MDMEERWSLSPVREDEDQRYAAELQLAELRSQQRTDADARMAEEMQTEEHMRRQSAPEQYDWDVQPTTRHPQQQRLTPRLRARILQGELIWRNVVEAILCVMLSVFLARERLGAMLLLALATLLAPVLGLVAARCRSWRLALPHVGATAGTLAVRAIAIPMGTENLLLAAWAAVCAVPTVHALHLATQWTALLWYALHWPRPLPDATHSHLAHARRCTGATTKCSRENRMHQGNAPSKPRASTRSSDNHGRWRRWWRNMCRLGCRWRLHVGMGRQRMAGRTAIRCGEPPQA